MFVSDSCSRRPVADNDIMRSRSLNPVPLPSVRVASSSTIDCESVKEMIDTLFFQLDQQREVMNRYMDMEASLARQIARNRHQEEDFMERCTSASPVVTLSKANMTTCARDLKMSRNGRRSLAKSWANSKPISKSELPRSKIRPIRSCT